MNRIFRIVLFFTVAWSAVALAQDSERDARDSENVDEIVVTGARRTTVATKTDTPLVEIPQSISIITAQQIAERGALNYQEVFRYSGIDTERSGFEVRSDYFSARGFPLKQYLDGLNKTPDFVYGSRIEVFTLERAEVLRGPSAVLYGAGSSGGLLNAVSKRPQFEFSGEVGGQVGNFDRRQLQADVTGPLSDQFAGRLVAVARTGELLSPGQKNDKTVVMPALTWDAGDRTEVTLIGLYSKEDLGTHTYLPRVKTLDAGPDDPPIRHNLFIGEPGFNRMKADEYSATLLLNHRFNDLVSFSSSSRYLDQKVDYAEVYGFPPWEDAARTIIGREFYILDADYYIYNSDNNVLFDFETGRLAHSVLVGVDWTLFKHGRQEGFSCRGFTGGTCWPEGSPPGLDVYNPVYGQPFTYGFTNAYKTESTALGFYVQDQMRWNDSVSIVIGARRDRTDNRRIGDQKFDNDATTLRAGVIWEVVKGVSPFLSYSESFTPLFGTDFFGNHFKPQEARQYEGGIKWHPTQNSLVTASYFDVEETGFLAGDPNNIQNRIQAGKIGVTGFEFEAALAFLNGFEVTANYSDIDAKTLEATVSQPAGTRVANLPAYVASLWVSKSFVVTSELEWRVGAGARRNGDEVDVSQLIRTPARTLYDAMAGLYYRDWSFSLNVSNLTDKEYYASCTATTCSPGITRVVIGTVSKKF